MLPNKYILIVSYYYIVQTLMDKVTVAALKGELCVGVHVWHSTEIPMLVHKCQLCRVKCCLQEYMLPFHSVIMMY